MVRWQDNLETVGAAEKVRYFTSSFRFPHKHTKVQRWKGEFYPRRRNMWEKTNKREKENSISQQMGFFFTSLS